MILAAAQTNPKHDHIKANLNDHCKLIELAAKNGADLIVFPEMSITGYEREKAKNFVFDVLDPRLNTLLKLAVDNKIIVIAGAPIRKNPAKPHCQGGVLAGFLQSSKRE